MRITNVYKDEDLTLKVEGRVSGPWAEELLRAFNEAERSAADRLTVDLTSVTFIDETGKQVLKRICSSRAEVIAAGCHTRSIIDGIRSCSD